MIYNTADTILGIILGLLSMPLVTLFVVVLSIIVIKIVEFAISMLIRLVNI